MANTKITSLTAIATSAIVSGDKIPIVDVSDTTQAITGTTKNFDGGDILFKSVGGTVSANTTFSGTAAIAMLKPNQASNGTVVLTNPSSTSPLIDLLGGDASALVLRSTDITTDATTKQARFASRHYTNSEEDVLMFYASNTNTNNILNYGGASSFFNAVTIHSFYVGTAITHTTGTEIVRISNALLNVNGTVQTDAFRLDQTPTAGAVTLTHYVTVNLNGTTYRIPVGTA